MRVVLAEKPSVARELAAFLGATARREGYLEGQGHQVTWAFGHLVTLKEPDDYDPALKRWSLATLPFVPDRFGLKLIDEKGAAKQFAVIKRLLRAADEVVCATDAGREGELIFRYIQELAGATGKPATRLWLNFLTASAVRDAFRRLRPLSDYDALYAAARCRTLTGSSASTPPASTPSATATRAGCSGASAGCRRRSSPSWSAGTRRSAGSSRSRSGNS